MEPPSERTLPIGLQGGPPAFVPAIAPQHQPQAIEQLMLIVRWGIKIPEKISVWGNAEPTFAQHAKTTKGNNSVQMQMDWFAP
jgi:hypothetical protein